MFSLMIFNLNYYNIVAGWTQTVRHLVLDFANQPKHSGYRSRRSVVTRRPGPPLGSSFTQESSLPRMNNLLRQADSEWFIIYLNKARRLTIRLQWRGNGPCSVFDLWEWYLFNIINPIGWAARVAYGIWWRVPPPTSPGDPPRYWEYPTPQGWCPPRITYLVQ